jgi:hypothetical protein
LPSHPTTFQTLQSMPSSLPSASISAITLAAYGTRTEERKSFARAD